jgi:hypothetical protein
MANYQFERQCRTATSEGYVITLEGERIGHVDLHYTPSIVYGSLFVEERVTEDEINDLIEVVDEDVVMTADVARDDFVVTVFQGRTVGEYSDEVFEEEEDEEAEE